MREIRTGVMVCVSTRMHACRRVRVCACEGVSVALYKYVRDCGRSCGRAQYI